MSRDKMPVRLTGLERSYAPWSSMHPQAGELPRCFVLDFRNVSGPGNLDDGRILRASLTPAELAEALGAIPALSLEGDDENIKALMRVIRLLRKEQES